MNNFFGLNNSINNFEYYLAYKNIAGFIFQLLIWQFIDFISTWRFYKKAGRKAWEATIPFYSSFILIRKIIEKPMYLWYILNLFFLLNYIITFKNLEYYIFNDLKHLGQKRYFYLNLALFLLFLINYFINLFIKINLIKYFGKDKPKHILFLILSFGLYIIYLNLSKNLTYKETKKLNIN